MWIKFFSYRLSSPPRCSPRHTRTDRSHSGLYPDSCSGSLAFHSSLLHIHSYTSTFLWCIAPCRCSSPDRREWSSRLQSNLPYRHIRHLNTGLEPCSRWDRPSGCSPLLRSLHHKHTDHRRSGRGCGSCSGSSVRCSPHQWTLRDTRIVRRCIRHGHDSLLGRSWRCSPPQRILRHKHTGR